MTEEINAPDSPDLAASNGVGSTKFAVEKKWGGAIDGSSGFVAVPMALLRLQSVYGLNATDMLVLINLLAHWWDAESIVYPRNSVVAKRMGVDARTVQRSTKKLLEKGFMQKVTLADGKRGFSFDLLAKRLGRDIRHAWLSDERHTREPSQASALSFDALLGELSHG